MSEVCHVSRRSSRLILTKQIQHNSSSYTNNKRAPDLVDVRGLSCSQALSATHLDHANSACSSSDINDNRASEVVDVRGLLC